MDGDGFKNVTKKMNAPYFKLYDIFYFIPSCLLSQIWETFFGVEFYRTVSKFRKRNRKLYTVPILDKT